MVAQRYVSLFNLPKHVKFTFVEKNILDKNISDIIKNVEVVIHLAAITDANSSFDRVKEIEETNYLGTKNIIEACLHSNAKLFFPSTTSVYGKQQRMVDEECLENDLKPQSPYAKYKLESEKMIHHYGETQGLKFVICRFGTIFGTSIGMRFHTAVNKFCLQAVTGRSLTIWKTAMDQKRPYLGLNDAINSIKFFVNKDIFNNRVYNILSSNNTVKEIFDIIRKTRPDAKYELVESEIMNQLSYKVSNQLVREEGFVFKDKIDDGINETLSLLDTLSH